MEYVTLSVPVQLWLSVDACVDNSVAVDVVEWGIESVEAGACVRDAGWRATALSGAPVDEIGWPARDHLLSITLRRVHWEWALQQIVRWETGDGDTAAAREYVRRALDATL